MQEQFDESDDEGMMDFLEAASTPPSTSAEQSLVAEEARDESSDRVEGARGTSPIIEDTEEVADAP